MHIPVRREASSKIKIYTKVVTVYPLAELLQIPLRNQSLDVSLPDIKLAVLGQRDGP
jgi:hypothetical protein